MARKRKSKATEQPAATLEELSRETKGLTLEQAAEVRGGRSAFEGFVRDNQVSDDEYWKIGR